MYYIYGKRTEPFFNFETCKWIDPDKVFRPINAEGIRVSKKKDAKIFETKEDAQNFLSKKKIRKGVIFEIRKS